MKKICVMLLLNSLFVNTMSSQTLVQQIEDAYSTLDSVSYVKNIILSFKEEDEKRSKESYEFSLKLRMIDFNNMDSIQKKYITDSLHRKYLCDTKNWREKRINKFASSVKDKIVHYVLNLRVDSCRQSDKHICLFPDTSSSPFNLFYFDNRSKVKFFVLVDNGEISHYDNVYRTFSKPIGKNAPKVFKKILRKNPKYLLYCYGLEQMNTILYMLNDKIYVYRIAQMKEYELSGYIKKFM